MKQRPIALLGCILVIATSALYWPVIQARFVVVDDDLYILDNPRVRGGLNLQGFKWAFTSTYAANWHPLTWISHQMDYALWGKFAGGHHLTSLVFHTLNTLVLFLLLRQLTGSIWRSFLVAALFGWHPLHVESVAWIAERKDVLSTFFFLLTIAAYARYADCGVQSPKSRVQSRVVFYCLALVLFLLGLMCKPMLVTLPFVLLLLDFWPLRRFQFLTQAVHLKEVASPSLSGRHESLLGRLLCFLRSGLFLEKLPFFALALAASAVTVLAQHAGGAVKSMEEVPALLRALNALSAYGHYLVSSLWPTDLCVFYPLPHAPPVGFGLLSGAALLLFTIWSLRVRVRQPWVLVGWLWFLGTLVPVIGLVQVGGQARADRYTYIPLIGWFFLVIWTADYWFKRWKAWRVLAVTTATAGLLGCLGLTRHQLGYWHDSVALCGRAVTVTKDNAFARNNLGVALDQEGRSGEAMTNYEAAVRIKPNYTQARYNLGIALAAAGQLEQAATQFSQALKQQPGSEILHNNLGVILAQEQQMDSAIDHFREAIKLNPLYPKPYLNYAVALQKQGQAGLALTNYHRAIELEPDWPEALDKLAFLLATCPVPDCHDPNAAVNLAERANQLTRHATADYLDTLSLAYCAAGQNSNAVFTAEQALAQSTRKATRALSEKITLHLASYRSGHCPELDWRNPPFATQASSKPSRLAEPH